MPIEIDGVKVPMSEIKDTDIHFVHTFMNKAKAKAAVMVYVDGEGNVNTCGVWRTKKGLDILDEKVRIIVL